MKKILILAMKTIAVLILFAFIAVSFCRLNEYNKGKNDSRRVVQEVVTETEHQPALISVDFDRLREKNSDIIAWLYCPDTPINYAIVQTTDNDYYLRRGLDKKYSYSGTLFADFRNAGDFTDENTIIYGHNMKNESMFGTLVNYERQEYFDKYPEMHLITPTAAYRIKLIAGVKETGTAKLFEDFLNPQKIEKYIKENVARSTFRSGYDYSENDRFVTFSTCLYEYDDARYILIGKLEKS